MFENILRSNFAPFLLLLIQDGSGGGTEGVRNAANETARVGTALQLFKLSWFSRLR